MNTMKEYPGYKELNELTSRYILERHYVFMHALVPLLKIGALDYTEKQIIKIFKEMRGKMF